MEIETPIPSKFSLLWQSWGAWSSGPELPNHKHIWKEFPAQSHFPLSSVSGNPSQLLEEGVGGGGMKGKEQAEGSYSHLGGLPPSPQFCGTLHLACVPLNHHLRPLS